MEEAVTTADFRPKNSYQNLPRGVHGFREYRVHDHEKETWVNYVEFVYRTSIGVAHICLGPGKSLRTGMETALKLLQDDRNPFLKGPDSCGVANSLKNYEDLASSTPLSLVIARSGAYTERSVGRILDTFTGSGLIGALQASPADGRPACPDLSISSLRGWKLPPHQAGLRSS